MKASGNGGSFLEGAQPRGTAERPRDTGVMTTLDLEAEMWMTFPGEPETAGSRAARDNWSAKLKRPAP